MDKKCDICYSLLIFFLGLCTNYQGKNYKIYLFIYLQFFLFICIIYLFTTLCWNKNDVTMQRKTNVVKMWWMPNVITTLWIPNDVAMWWTPNIFATWWITNVVTMWWIMNIILMSSNIIKIETIVKPWSNIENPWSTTVKQYSNNGQL